MERLFFGMAFFVQDCIFELMKEFVGGDALTQEIVESGLVSWDDLVRSVRRFHYGRNANREDVTLVWRERKGTCSSKYAFLKHVAALNGWNQVQLFMGIYKMNGTNTPGVEKVLAEHQINYIPEAHCYLKVNGEPLDCTSVNADFDRICPDLLEEQEIEPHQVAEYKVTEHRKFLEKWLNESSLNLSFSELWAIREECITQLSL